MEGIGTTEKKRKLRSKAVNKKFKFIISGLEREDILNENKVYLLEARKYFSM